MELGMAHQVVARGLVAIALACVGCGGSVIDPPADSGHIPFPDPFDGGPLGASCGLESPAFCETFEDVQPGGRGGDLDERVWAFSRWDHALQYLWARLPAHTYPEGTALPLATFCGET